MAPPTPDPVAAAFGSLEGGDGKIAPELARGLAKMATIFAAAGIPMPEGVLDQAQVAEVYLKQRVGDMAYQLADLLKGCGLYLAGPELVTVDEGTGQFEIMTPDRFVGWLDQHVAFFKMVAKDKEFVSVPGHRGKELIAAPQFRAKIPQIEGINTVKLPVRRKDGTLELLQQGFDAESRIFTLRGGIDYDEDMDWTDGLLYLQELLKEYPFEDGRAMATHIAAMLTTFCMNMLPRGAGSSRTRARPPLFVWNANQVGSGKTRLAQMALIPVFGTGATVSWGDRMEENKKELDAYAQAFEPYVFMDDMSGFFKAPLLNRWLTSSLWMGRVMGGKQRFCVPLRAFTAMTGNNVELSDDLQRRSLTVQLFSAQPYDERVLPADAPDITEEYLAKEETRSKILASLWAMVRHAEEVERETPAKISRKLGSFEGWCAVVPRVLIHCGLPDPTDKKKEEVSPELKDRKNLVRAVLAEIVKGSDSMVIELSEIIPVARRHGCFIDILGSVDDMYKKLDDGKGRWKDVKVIEEDDIGGKTTSTRSPTEEDKRTQAAAWADLSMRKMMASRFKKPLAGLRFQDARGNEYQFGDRQHSRLSSITVVKLKKGALG